MISTQSIVLYDGDCSFCNFWVRFVIKRDEKKQFKFASLSSETSNNLTKLYYLKENLDSVVLVKNNEVFIKSSAVIEIAKELSGFWSILSIFRFLPPIFRNFLYDFVAKNRKLLNSTSTCKIYNSVEFKDRFIVD